MYLGALMVAGGRAYPTLGIAIDGQPGYVDQPATYALVRLTLAAYAQRECVTHELGGIKPANAVAEGYRGQVDEVNQRVYLLELLALQHAAYECLAGRTIA